MKGSSFIFKENHVFIEENNLSDKVVTADEELDAIDIDGIGNLVDLPRLMFINEKCTNLNVVVNSGWFTKNNNRKRKSRSSYPEVFLVKGVLKMCSKFTVEHSCRSTISIKLQSNVIEITLQHGCSPVNVLHILRMAFTMKTSEWLLLEVRSFTSL